MLCAFQFLTEALQLHWAAVPAPVSFCHGRAPSWLGLLLFSSLSILLALQDEMMGRQHLFPELSPQLCGFQHSAIICILPGTKHVIKLIARG